MKSNYNRQPDPWVFMRRYTATITDQDGINYTRVIYGKSACAVEEYARAYFANTEPAYKKIAHISVVEG